jgi:hypothetical protein
MWKPSNQIADVQEAISIVGMVCNQGVVLSPTVPIVVLGSITNDVPFNVAQLFGTMRVARAGTTSSYVGKLYLTSSSNGVFDGYSPTLTGITFGAGSIPITLDGLTYNSPNETEKVYLAFAITTPDTVQGAVSVVPYTAGTVPYSTQYTYSTWTHFADANIPVIAICQ